MPKSNATGGDTNGDRQINTVAKNIISLVVMLRSKNLLVVARVAVTVLCIYILFNAAKLMHGGVLQKLLLVMPYNLKL